MLNLITRVMNACFEDVAFVTQASRSTEELALEFGQVATAAVTQLDPLEVAPDPFIGIEVWGVGGQGFEMEAGGSALSQEVLDRLTPMDRGAVPDDQELAREVTQEMAEEADHRRTFEGAGADLKEQAALRGEGADHREMVTGEGDGQGRGLPLGGVGSDPGRQEIEAGFIRPDDGSLFFSGLCLRVGHVSASQVSTWTGSRWVALTSGCWTLQPRAWRRRLTWVG